MLTDWFTICAQIVNFLILVWLLKRFLYQPVLNAIDAREKRIAAELADAAARQAEADRERDEFQQKNANFERERRNQQQAIADEAAAERQRLLAEARAEAENLSAKLRATLAAEAGNLQQELLRRVQREVFAIADKALNDLADARLEERLAAVLIRRLRSMDNADKQIFADAAAAADASPLVRSAFELPAEQQAALRQAFAETFTNARPLRFETQPDPGCGVELVVNGQKLVWSVADYLAELEKNVSELLSRRDNPGLDA